MTNVTLRPLLFAAGLWSLVGCASVVKQDAHTGPDGLASGAEKITLNEDGEGVSKGVVSYPAGDRVDWKVFEVPKPGDVDVVLKWESPRPGLDLSMNILDDTFHVVKRLRPANGQKRRKTAQFKAEPGKYYVQVYASRRGDAGDYTVEVNWYAVRPVTVASANVDVPYPPHLPAVPNAPAQAGGGAGGTNPNAPLGTEENPCQVGQQGCTAAMLYINPGCPTEKPAPLGSPCPMVNPACPEAGPLPVGTPCPPKVIPPKAAQIIERQVSGQDLIITLDRGSNQGIAKGWTGVVYLGKSGTKLVGGAEFRIFKVTQDESYGKIKKLGLDRLGHNTRVELRPPPANP